MQVRWVVIVGVIWLGSFDFLIAQNNIDRKVRTDNRKIKSDTTESHLVEVNRILIVGNKKTHDRIILRELAFKSGDTIQSNRISDALALDKNKLYNLRLFNTVELRSISISDRQVDILVEVAERWYVFPVPIFELSDRNFNEWWRTFDHDFKRVNYGLRLYKYNFRGRNETLRFTAQFGFTRKFDVRYTIPNLDKSQKHGLSFGFVYAEPKNLSYFTGDHSLLFLKSQSTLRTSREFGVSYTYRKSFYDRHSLGFEYRNSDIADTIAFLNPEYYSGGQTHQEFESLIYSFNSEHRDVIAYPLKGSYSNIYLKKIGLGISSNVNQFEINLVHARYLDLKGGFYFSNFSSVYASTPTSQPYSLYNAIGYRSQFLRGYEVSLIEGSRFFLSKSTIKKRIFSRGWHFASMFGEQFNYFPLAIYLKGYADVGYVENTRRYEALAINNRLSNKFLVGFGGGVDVVTWYDTILRFEYSFTREGNRGFFFNIKKEF